MAGVNKVILVGRLGADPEVRYTSNGAAVATFRMATSESWTNKDGERQERTEWHKIVAWRKLAEICAEYLSKGKQVYIEGRLQTREWEDKDGVKRWTTEITAQNMQMLGSPGDKASTGQTPIPPHPGDATAHKDADSTAPEDDDIPF